jgi:NADH:quinone reductase (non-electrogenic)
VVNRPRVVIIGGGFAGLSAAKALKSANADVTVIDRTNHHLFQPLLYQVATGGLSPANIAAPLRWVLKRQANCEVALAEVCGFDLDNRRVLTDVADFSYDTLVVAAGSRHSYFGKDDWAKLAPGLKTVEDATQMRGRIYAAFEHAELTSDLEERRALLNFAIVGGGPTGVELAGALAEIARDVLTHDFRHIDPADARIMLVEAGPRILEAYPEDLSEKALLSLERLGVTVRLGTRVTSITPTEVELTSSTGVERWPTRTVLWAAGVLASPLTKSLAAGSCATLDRAGRVIVERDLSLPGRPEVFVLGDMASYAHQTGKPLPGVAQVAIQQGRFVAKLIDRRLRGKRLPEFHYRDLGNLATIGKSAAVAEIGRLHFSGLIAWLLWLFVHLMHIVNFRNRLLVLLQWSWNYFTHDRSARLITGDAPSDDDLAALQKLIVPTKPPACPSPTTPAEPQRAAT